MFVIAGIILTLLLVCFLNNLHDVLTAHFNARVI